MAISGLSYRALPYGPVPNNWKYLPLIDGIEQLQNDMETLLITNISADISYFSESEKGILDTIIKRFKGITASEISSLSHLEEAWIENHGDTNKPISFDYAFSLKAL